MAFKKKAWVDRVAEFINRRTLTKEDGSTELVTVARNEGAISKEGDAFNASNMNDLEQRIDEGFNTLFDYSYKKAADSLSANYCPVMYTKIAGWVHVVYTGDVVRTLPANIWTTVTVLPAGYRPKCNIPFTWNYGSSVYIGYVYTNGNIALYPTDIVSLNYQVTFNVSYPAA